MKNSLLLAIATVLLASNIWAQDSKPTIIDLDQAVALALENNHDLFIAKVQSDKAENSATLGNAGALPTLRATAGTNYSNQNSDLEFATGQTQNVSGAESAGQNASLGLSQVLFAGGALQRTYSILKSASQMANIAELQQLNTTIVQTQSQYFAIVLLGETVQTAETNLAISADRYARAELKKELGGSNTTELLAAEVDLNRDKITLMDARTQLLNAKTLFKTFVGIEGSFELVPVVKDEFAAVDDLMSLINAAFENNPTLQMARISEETAIIQQKLAQSTLFPSLSAQVSYGLNQSQAEAGFLTSSQQTGLNAGVSLTYDLFGGGRSRTQRQNAALDVEIAQRQRIKTEETIQAAVINAAEVYVNARAKYELEKKSVAVAQQNFDKTKERYDLGQLSYLQLREAQLGLLNAQNGKTSALFQARNAYLALWQLVQSFEL